MLDFWGAICFILSVFFFLVPIMVDLIENPSDFRSYFSLIGCLLYLLGSICYLISHLRLIRLNKN